MYRCVRERERSEQRGGRMSEGLFCTHKKKEGGREGKARTPLC